MSQYVHVRTRVLFVTRVVEVKMNPPHRGRDTHSIMCEVKPHNEDQTTLLEEFIQHTCIRKALKI